MRLWRGDILENFGLHVEGPFYQQNEGFFAFTSAEFAGAEWPNGGIQDTCWQGEGVLYTNKVWMDEDIKKEDI